MIQEGVAKDDVEAEELGQKLVVGGIINHVTGAHHFHDAAYLYFFIRETIHPLWTLGFVYTDEFFTPMEDILINYHGNHYPIDTTSKG